MRVIAVYMFMGLSQLAVQSYAGDDICKKALHGGENQRQSLIDYFRGGPESLSAILKAEAKKVSSKFAALNVYEGATEFAHIERGSFYNPYGKIETQVNAFDLQITPIPQWMTALWLISTNQMNEERSAYFGQYQGENDYAVITYGGFFSEKKNIAVNYDHPSTNLSLEDFSNFLVWLNNLSGVKKSGCRYGLPTSEEWESALRNSTSDGVPIREDQQFLAFVSQKYRDYSDYIAGTMTGTKTHNIRSFSALPTTGVRHMITNVWELTATQEPTLGMNQMRGGCWDSGLWGVCKGSLRASEFVYSTMRHSFVGARMVRECVGQSTDSRSASWMPTSAHSTLDFF